MPTYDLEGKYACRAGGFIGEIHIRPEAIPIFVPAAVGPKDYTPPSFRQTETVLERARGLAGSLPRICFHGIALTVLEAVRLSNGAASVRLTINRWTNACFGVQYLHQGDSRSVASHLYYRNALDL